MVRHTSPVPWTRAARERRATVFMIMGSDSGSNNDSDRQDEEEEKIRRRYLSTSRDTSYIKNKEPKTKSGSSSQSLDKRKSRDDGFKALYILSPR